MSVLHATYLRCIKPFIGPQTVALEIGPGRGAWTKTMLEAKEIYALDALPETHNGFFEYLGHPRHVHYFEIGDFDCNMLPDNHFNYVFSFGCLCHVSFEGIKQYATNIYPKLLPGANCFWMVADYDKYNNALRNLDNLSFYNILVRRKFFLWNYVRRFLIHRVKPVFVNPFEDDTPAPGRWYNAGVQRTCSMLKEAGYDVIDPDVGTCLRDPIIHFVKP